MDRQLPNLYADYGKYSNFRNFPLDIDGLKPVERRILLSAYKIARSNFAKSRQVSSYTTGHYHPHGDCYDTIVQLVRQGFLTGQGNFGTNIGIEKVSASADRYTECKLSSFTNEIMFKYIKNVPFVDTELNDKEPMHLPTMFPACLMGTSYTQGIGFGFRTFIPCYDIKDLYKRLLYLLGVRKRKITIAPLTDCKIICPPEDLESLLTNGTAKIDVEGIIEVDSVKSTVILRSWPPGKKFQSLLNKFSNELESGMIGFTDLSTISTEIVFQVLRERNRVKIFNDFVNKLKKVLKGSISFENTMVDLNNNVVIQPIDTILLNTYKMFSSVNEEMLKRECNKTIELIEEYNMLTTIKPLLIQCIREGKNINDSVGHISKISKITKKVILGLIDKYKIKKLLTLDTDTKDLEAKVQECNDNLKNIDKYILDQYNKIFN
jgi:DNA gyrase/topoisomerase IV subunit A